MGVDANMLARIKGKENWITEDEAVDLSYRLGVTFGHDSFWIFQEPVFMDNPQHALTIVKPYEDEYPDEGYYSDYIGKVIYIPESEPIVADEDEQFVEVHIKSRYYGHDYERGNMMLIINVAEWLEYMLPVVEIWYGGDSSSFPLKPFNSMIRAGMKIYCFEVGNEPYNAGFNRFEKNIPNCDFCNHKRMINYGGGGEFSLYECMGCGKRVIYDGLNKDIARVLRPNEKFSEALSIVRNERS